MRLDFKNPRGFGAIVTRNIGDDMSEEVRKRMGNFNLFVGRPSISTRTRPCGVSR